MKARPITQETVYLYHISLDSQRGQKIVKALEEISVQVAELREDLLGETLGYCLGLPGFSKSGLPAPEESFDQEVLVMKGFTRQSMDRMLKKLKQKEIPSVALKAVLTEHNSKWRCIDFFRELEREHMFMNAYQKLRRQILVAEQRMDPSQALCQAIQRARELLTQRDQIEYKELVRELEQLNNVLEEDPAKERRSDDCHLLG